MNTGDSEATIQFGSSEFSAATAMAVIIPIHSMTVQGHSMRPDSAETYARHTYSVKFLSVNLNKSYGKSSSSSTAAGYGNGRPRSAGSGGGMVVLSRPRSSSGASALKPPPRLAVPPPVNLPSLRKEHERLDPALSKPSSGHGGSGLGIGNSSSMSWTKPTPPISDFSDKDGGSRTLSTVEQRSFSSSAQPQGFTEKTVILKGEDFPSLMATSTYFSKQKQKQANENSDVWAGKAELPSVVDMNPKLRSSPPTMKNNQGSDGGSNRVSDYFEQSRQEGGTYPGALPVVKLRRASDWDDDERDRNHVDHYDGRVFPDVEPRSSSLSKDSGRGDPYGKEFLAFRKEDRNFNSWRITVEPNREILTAHQLHVDKDHFGPRNSAMSRGTGKEGSHDRLPFGDRKEFGSGMGIGTGVVTEGSIDRAEVWQRGKLFNNSKISKGHMSPRIKGLSTYDSTQSFTKEKLMSNVGRSYTENASWGGKDTFSSDVMLDLKGKVLRKRKEAVKHADLFDPARESFEAELERVQRQQEQERQRVMEEQTRLMEVARREAEERERIVREEEQRRRLLEEEAREAAWRAEQEKLEAARRAEELRIAREEEKKKILMEEERRKEAARQKLLELEARIASRQTEANANDRMKEKNSVRDSDLSRSEKTETIAEHISSSPSLDSPSMNSLSESGFRSHTSSVENHSFYQHGKTENNWNNDSNSIIKSQDQDSGHLSGRQDGYSSNRSAHRKQFQGIYGPKSVATSFKRGMSGDQAQIAHSWDINRDCDQFNGRSNIDAMFSGWDHGHFDGSQLGPYSERSFQNSEVDDLASFSRVRHTIRQPRVPPPPSISSSIHNKPLGAASTGPNSSFSVPSDARINQTGRNEESNVQSVYDCSYHQRIIEPGVQPRMPELMEEPAQSLLQTEEKSSPRYDSQSSLSVSNPPSSPTQLSNDEFDDCGGSPAITISAEEENMTFSEGKSMIPELDVGKIELEVIPFCHGEDDEWAIEDNEEMQEEDHDEGSDSNQEDNGAHENDTWEIQMKNKLEALNVVVEKPMEIGHASYGIESNVQLGTSGHYLFNKDSEFNEKTSTNAGHDSDSTAEHIFADSRAVCLQSEEKIPDKILNASSEIVEEAVKEQKDMIFGLVTTADHPTDGIRASKNSGQNPIAAVSRLPLSSTSSLTASVHTSFGQSDVPAKLQFGLFSSPPLIPSPLPTIQIGSIQMPLPLNSQIDSFTHVNPPHPPFLQFGQIVYAPPTSQSVLPISAQTFSYAHHPSGSSSKNQVSQDPTSTKGLDKRHSSYSADKQPVCSPGITNPSQSNLDSEQPTALLDIPRDDVINSKRRIASAVSDEKKDFQNLISHSGYPDAISNKNFRSMVYSKRTRGRSNFDSFSSARKSLAGLKAPGTMSEIRGSRLTYNVRNAGSLSSFARTETSYVNANRPQRKVQRHIQGTEYRVKESGARQMQCTEGFKQSSYNWKPNSGNDPVGIPLRNVGKKGAVISKSTKLMNEEAALSDAQVMGVISNMKLDNKRETLQTSMSASTNFHGGKGNFNINGLPEDDIDAPLRSGIVRVFNQPGIEASSDGDGFVEVPHRHRATLSSNGISYKSEMVTTLTDGGAAKNVHSVPAISHRRPSSDPEGPKLTTTSMICQTIAAIGSRDVNSADYDSNFNSLKSSRAGSDLAIANDRGNVEPSLSFGNNIIALDKASVPLGTWGTVHLNQQAVTSNQSQLDESSNPVQCNPIGLAKVSPDDNKHATTTMIKDKSSFSSENLPNFPFDEERIQFGAVMSSPPLPPFSQPAPSGIWPPGSVILNSSIIHHLTATDHSDSKIFDGEKCPTGSCTHLDDTEAEAEAAASAVAVAVITNDEITVSTLGTSSISGIGTKGLSCPGVTSCTSTTGQSASEESLIVTLPADLSVDAPLSLWPPLPTLHSSRPMLSHMAGPQPSPFPFFDSNSMLGGPIFAFRSQDDSSGTLAQQQQNPTFLSGPTGTWPQCHSGVESSFYGSPAGFPAPFMSSPTGLSGVHGHPPMVFYNHFAPVGQLGQVGLSYMGGAYLPTGKQTDWTHGSDGTATVNVSKADTSNLNVVFGQQNAAHVPTSIQHLSTGSAVMQVTSPFTLFNLRPFQSSAEIPVPAQQWPPIPHPHSPSSLRHSTAPEQLQSMPSDLHHSTAVDLPDELSLVESSSSNSINAQTIRSSSRNHSTTSIQNDSKGILPNSAIGKTDDPGGSSSQKISSGSQYGRRNTFHGKYGNTNSSNRNIGSSKMKQIYVAKTLLTTPGTSS
ncbi:hypothetical protein IEQ34_015543 [Dendrobium chrysotoxum]|uniref:Uncharacterized protein n=1 Tax=Dendrobium chrysotoxum TaxID=161865 RepID=A0AAV7GHF0_DENCH|nr:hypothetical protein IEQ34_015543 [Dendrobium chrysotoxum]